MKSSASISLKVGIYEKRETLKTDLQIVRSSYNKDPPKVPPNFGNPPKSNPKPETLNANKDPPIRYP